MLFSESWLREWVNPAIDSDELMARITMAGLEVDGSQAAAVDFSGVVVGEVLSAQPHPDADKLRVCEVSDGTGTQQVVCGAANVAAGQKIAFARVGAVLGEDFQIRKAKLRGMESRGMVCSAEELGLEESSEGILVLPADAPPGQDVREYLQLDDTLIEVDLTPNRGDCLSIAGLARELGVLTDTPVNRPTMAPVPALIEDSLSVELLNPEDCPRYLGRVIRDVDVNAPSPLWLKEKLRRSDIRAIDPVVDVTNYVLMELGHPMHAFDLDKLSGGIRVRRATEGEGLTLLDGRTVELSPDTLIIADHEKPLAIAGVMGGEDSAVSGQTGHILLESAFFNPLSIAGRARAYGLQTDAAHRYERGVDYALAREAMERATALLLDIVGGKPGPIVEAVDALPTPPPVRLRRNRVATVLGMTLGDDEVTGILTGLGLSLTESDAESWTFAVPSWRFDISIEVDLIEELARIHGYDRLPTTAPPMRMALRAVPEGRVSLRELRRTLRTLGYQEIISYSFVEPDLEARLQERHAEPIRLANPISQELSVMRGGLWSGLLKTLKHNQNRQQLRLRLFESGLVFNHEAGETHQVPRLGGLLWGARLPEQWAEKSESVDFYDARGDVEMLLALGHEVDGYRFEAASHPALHPGQSARIMRENQPCGWVGTLHPRHQKDLDVPGRVVLFELDLAQVTHARIPRVTDLSRYPTVRRDLALLVDRAQETGQLLDCLREEAGDCLTDLVVFDLYMGENIDRNKKSLALGLTFQHPSRTLNDEEINSIIDSCIKALEDKFNAELRK